MKLLLAEQQQFTLGSDPEVFAKKDKEFIPCIGLIGGSKKRPVKLISCYAQEDNVMAEFNTVPANNKEEFVRNVGTARDEISFILRKNGLMMAHSSVALFKVNHLNHPQAKMFGCDPDQDIYQNNTPYPVISKNYRFAGGHIHLGFVNQLSMMDRNNIIQSLDSIILPFQIYFDPSSLRCSMYGRMGKYRLKPYGFEYRTPSNWWIFSNRRIALMYELVNYTLHRCMGWAYHKDALYYNWTHGNRKMKVEARKMARNTIIQNLGMEPEELIEVIL